MHARLSAGTSLTLPCQPSFALMKTPPSGRWAHAVAVTLPPLPFPDVLQLSIDVCVGIGICDYECELGFTAGPDLICVGGVWPATGVCTGCPLAPLNFPNVDTLQLAVLKLNMMMS